MRQLVRKFATRLFGEILLAFLVAFAFLLVIGILSVRGLDAAARAHAKADHAGEVRAGLGEELRRLKDIQLDARDAALSGRTLGDADFKTAVRQFDELLRRLQYLPHDSSGQVRNFEMLSDRVHRVVDNASRLTRARSPSDRARLLREGADLMEQSEAMVDALIAHESAVEAEHIARSRSMTGLAYGAVYSSVALSLVLLVLAAVRIRSDIARREALAEQVKVSKEQLQAILDNTPALVSIKDAAGRYVFANRGYEKLVPGGAAAIVGRTDAQLWPEAEARTFRANDEFVLEEGRVLECEEVMPQHDGHRTFITLKFPMMGTTDKLVCGVAMDITERKKVENLKNEVIGMASHDLRTPLTIIQGALRFVLAEDHPFIEPGARPILELALRNSRHMLDVIDTYLDFSALESGRASLSRETVDLGVLAREAIESMRLFEAARGLRYELAAAGEPLKVAGDPTRLREVIDNLMSNAAKFSPDGERIEVDLRRRDGRARFSIRDHGPGIRKEFAPKVFKKFARDAVAPGRPKGTGLGLSIAKLLVERMGGTIGFESRENEGATFFFELPLAAGGADDAAQA